MLKPGVFWGKEWNGNDLFHGTTKLLPAVHGNTVGLRMTCRQMDNYVVRLIINPHYAFLGIQTRYRSLALPMIAPDSCSGST